VPTEAGFAISYTTLAAGGDGQISSELSCPHTASSPMKPSTTSYFLLALVLLFANATHAEPADALLAGGCFWCMEVDFEKQPGVLSAIPTAS
jgi:hypothetical protein